MKSGHNHIGSDFDQFLTEEGIRDEVEAAAIRRVLASQLREEMDKNHLTKAMMARRMHTSRSVVERLLDPEKGSMTLATLSKAANAVGKKLKVEMVDG